MCASRAPWRETDESLLQRMRPLVADYLTLTGRADKRPPHRLVEVTCTLCGKTFWKTANMLQLGRSGCTCQWEDKWGKDPRVRVLGDRYHAIEQRCTPGHHTSKAHGDRGIELRFESREHFIRWTLEHLPHETYRGVQFDRIDGEGHYEPGNLQLSTPRQNNSRRRDTVYVPYMGQQVARDHLWDLIKTDRPDFSLSKSGVVKALQRGQTVEQILARPHPRASSTSSTPDPEIVSLYRG